MQVARLTKFIGSAALSLFVTLVTTALALYGTISMSGARIALLIAWMIGLAGIITSEPVCSKPWKRVLSIAIISAIALGGGLIWLDNWALATKSNIDTQPTYVAPPPPPPAIPIAKTPKSGAQPRASGQGILAIVENHGTVERGSVRGTKIHGAPPANSKITVWENMPGSKVGTLDIQDVEMDFMPADTTIPAPSEPSMSGDGFETSKARVNNLTKEIEDWNWLKTKGAPPFPGKHMTEADQKAYGVASNAYWKIEMEKFHDAFGPRIMLTAAELRNCGYPVVKSIYWREHARINSWGVIGMTESDLRTLADQLPEKDSELNCK